MFGRSFVYRRGRRSNQNSNIVPPHLLCTGTMAPEYGNHDARAAEHETKHHKTDNCQDGMLIVYLIG